MAIATVLLGILLLAMGSLPTVAGGVMAGSLRSRLPQTPVSVSIKAVPTWRVLGGQLDQMAIAVDQVLVGGLPLQDLRVLSGPIAANGPVRLRVTFAVPLPELKAQVEQQANQSLTLLAADMGLPGTALENIDLRVEPGRLPFRLSGSINALGGLVNMTLEVAGMPAILAGNQLGVRQAVLIVEGQQQQLGDVPLMALPPLPAGVSLVITGVEPQPDRVRLTMAVTAPDMQAIRDLLSGQGAGNLPAIP